MNRGSLAGVLEQHEQPDSFNEAPIHESGKCGAARIGEVSLNASMRPRFMNRGSASSARPIALMTICFNEAPIHESGKCSLHTELCQ